MRTGQILIWKIVQGKIVLIHNSPDRPELMEDQLTCSAI